MSKTNLVLLWILAFLGFVFDLLSGSNTFVRYGFIAFNLLFLLAVGIQCFFKKSKMIKLTLISISFLSLLSSVAILIIGLIFKMESFGLGIIVYGLFTLAFASGLTTLLFVLVKPIIIHKENIGRRDLIVFFYVLVFLLTHLLVVPNNTEVPKLTYLISILVVCFLLIVLEVLSYKFFKLPNQYFLSITIFILIIVSNLSFLIQVIFLWPLQIYVIVHLAITIFSSPEIKDILYKQNSKLGV